MDSAAVYAKTPKGQEEIATRAHRLPARVRAMLIIVDGHRSVGQLLAQHPAPDEAAEHLRVLAEGGFIAGPADAQPAVEAATAPFDAAAARERIAHLLVDFIGPDADYFTERIERMSDREELQREVEKLHAMLEGSVGRAKAEHFRDSVSPLLR